MTEPMNGTLGTPKGYIEDNNFSDDSSEPRDQRLDPAQPQPWVLNYRTRSENLRAYFDLPPGENLIEEFFCALRGRLLHQGRLYVFDHYICFYSNVFGLVRKHTLAIKDIRGVFKKTHLHFPNSIAIETVHGRFFYTNLFSRDEAYTMISRMYHDNSDKPAGPVLDRPSGTRSAMSGAELLTEDVLGEMAGDQRGASGSANNSMTVDTTSTGTGNTLLSRMSTVPALRSNSLAGQAATRIASTGGVRSFTEQQPSRNNRVYVRRGSDCTDGRTEDGEDDDDDRLEERIWQMESNEWPLLDKSMQLVVEAELPGTCRQVVSTLLGPSSHFLEDFHSKQGDRRVTLSSWRRADDEEVPGFVRDIRFVSPIKGAFSNWGKSETQCYQLQRLRAYSGKRVVFESQQTMQDIPYGDCFTVDMRWDFEQVDPDSPGDAATTRLRAHCKVPFTKRCMFRVVIEKGVMSSVGETMRALMQEAQDALLQAQQEAQEPAFGTVVSLAGTSMGGRSVSMMGASASQTGRPGTWPSISAGDDSASDMLLPASGPSVAAVAGRPVHSRLWSVFQYWGDVLVGNAVESPRMAGLMVLLALLLVVQLVVVVCLYTGRPLPGQAVPVGTGVGMGAGPAALQRLQLLDRHLEALQQQLELLRGDVAATISGIESCT